MTTYKAVNLLVVKPHLNNNPPKLTKTQNYADISPYQICKVTVNGYVEASEVRENRTSFSEQDLQRSKAEGERLKDYHDGWKELSRGSRHLEKNFFSSLKSRNTLALPSEWEGNQILIGFKIWIGTSLQSSMNRPYPVDVEWILANHLPCELFCLGLSWTESLLCSSFASSDNPSKPCLSREFRRRKTSGEGGFSSAQCLALGGCKLPLAFLHT